MIEGDQYKAIKETKNEDKSFIFKTHKHPFYYVITSIDKLQEVNTTDFPDGHSEHTVKKTFETFSAAAFHMRVQSLLFVPHVYIKYCWEIKVSQNYFLYICGRD